MASKEFCIQTFTNNENDVENKSKFLFFPILKVDILNATHVIICNS